MIELEADENHSYFWMRQALTWPWHGGGVRVQRLRGLRTMFAGGPDPPPPPPSPTECDFEGPHSKISAMGPEFLAMALRAIMTSGPSTVSHLVSTPILPFPYCNPTEEFFSTWRWKVHNRPPHKQVPLLLAIDDACNDITGGDQCQACICHAGRFFSDL